MRIHLRRNRHGTAFRHPLDPAPRTAILVPGFAESGQIRVFPHGWTNAAAQFGPTAIAGPMEALRALGRLNIELQHAVIAFTDLKARLSEHDRDFLWQAFGVPVFEQCLDTRNELVAAECEAHDGVHLWQSIPVEWDGEVEHARCACGSTVPRLMERRMERIMAMAAMA